MNLELAQIVTLITHGNEYLSLSQKDIFELFPLHLTFMNVCDVSFHKGKKPDDILERSQVVAKEPHSWFLHLETEGIQYLKLGIVSFKSHPQEQVTSKYAGNGTRVIQTDKQTCWQSHWSLKNPRDPQGRIWAVGYWEGSNLPVITSFPDIKTAYQDLESSLTEAQIYSKKCMIDWEKYFAEAIELLNCPNPVPPYYTDLLPDTYENIKGRQLLAGALKAWVFGGMGSWNDVYITDPLQIKEYQQISTNLYKAIIQSVFAVTNSTAGCWLEVAN